MFLKEQIDQKAAFPIFLLDFPIVHRVSEFPNVFEEAGRVKGCVSQYSKCFPMIPNFA
jgi:hypothetical protein